MTHPLYIRLLGLLCLCLPALAAADLKASLDRDTLYEGETVLLTLEADGRFPELDFGVLTQDFLIAGNQRSSEVRWVNGQQSVREVRVIQLEPKRTGTLTIPALKAGRHSTEPLTLTVLSGSSSSADGDIFLEVSAEPDHPYVQSQVRLVERLFYAVPLLEGALDRAGIPDAVLERVGEDLSYVAVREGKTFRVVERRYALFPEKSGPLTIPPTEFIGRVAQSAAAGGIDRFFNRGRRASTASPPIVLNVRPRPDSYTGSYWLPSPELTLNEVWPEDGQPVRVGEPVTRTLRLEARGLSASQLPELALPTLANANVYPEQPVSETGQDGPWLVGRREQSVAIVPTQEGDMTLPEVRLSWWNTERDVEETAVIPARTVTVQPAAGALPPAPVPLEQPAPQAEPPVVVQEAPQPLAWRQWLAQWSLPTAPALWYWTSLGLLLLWLLTLFAWLRDRRRRRPVVAAVQPDVLAPSAAAARQALQQACRNSDAPAAAQALLTWAAAEWPAQPPRNLSALAARLDNDAAPLHALDQALYARAGGRWDGKRLWQAVKGGLRERRAAPAAAGLLPPLYPQRPFSDQS